MKNDQNFGNQQSNDDGIPDEEKSKIKTYKRQLKNYLIDPFIQVRLGIYANIVSLVFALSLFVVFYLNMNNLIDIVVELTEVESEVKELAAQFMSQTNYWLIAVTSLFWLMNSVLTIIITHKFVGPMVAFKKMIRSLANGIYQDRVFLRKNDYFQDIANDLNRLAQILEEKKKIQEKKGA